MNIVFFRIGWMEHYRGPDDEHIRGGGRFVDENQWGGEVFNFRPFEGSVYGFVQPQGRLRINIDRLGAADADDHVAGILAVWVAKNPEPEGGSYIVGWYTNATVYREWQEPPPGSNRHIGGRNMEYNVTALADDAVLLPSDERQFKIPRATGNRNRPGMGQSNVWYADKYDDEVRDLKRKVLEYIKNRLPPKAAHTEAGTPRQLDPARRQEVERIAVEHVMKHYEEKGWKVDSVERDNVGWDLEAVRRDRRRRLEVKGLSGSETRFELTPNEYRKMRKHRKTYRICVVTDALGTPNLAIFRFVRGAGGWKDKDGRLLEIVEATAARCTVG